MFSFITNAIKLLIIAILSLFYYPVNLSFITLQKYYRQWQVHDRVSFYIATPLYYLLFLITSILSFPLESLASAYHPPLDGFR